MVVGGEFAERLAWQRPQSCRGEVASKPKPYCLGAQVLCWVLRSPHCQELGAHQGADESLCPGRMWPFAGLQPQRCPGALGACALLPGCPWGSTAIAPVMFPDLKDLALWLSVAQISSGPQRPCGFLSIQNIQF